MTLLITGADGPLGQLATSYFQKKYDVKTANGDIDLRQPTTTGDLVKGVGAILHLGVYDPPLLIGSDSEQEWLDIAARGTYVLMQEACQAGVERVVLVSSMGLFDVYPPHYVVDETWQPEPAPTSEGLAPYLAELTCREFSRQQKITSICLRFGTLSETEGTCQADALTALNGALVMPLNPMGYRWLVFHVYSGKRFEMQSAKNALGFVQETN